MSAGGTHTCALRTDGQTICWGAGAPPVLTAATQGQGTLRSTSTTGIQCPGDCAELYNQLDTITLTAEPASGQTFLGWEGYCTGTSPTCDVLMNAPRSTTARFSAGTSESPVAAFTASPASGTAPLEVVLDYSGSYDPDGQIIDYAWSVNGASLTGATTSGDTKTLTLNAPGTYLFKLTVTDDDGLSASAERTVEVYPANQSPVAAFSATPNSGDAPLEVVLDYTDAYDPDGQIVDYAWSVNGAALTGAVTSGDTKTLTLDASGTYVFKLTVTDDDDLSASAERTVTVTSSATGGRTMILTNRQKLAEFYGIERTDALMAKLQELASHEAVQGQVLEVDQDSSVAQAYANRGADYDHFFKANAVAEAIRKQVVAHWDASQGELEYLVIVGDDRVLPFRRLLDGDPFVSDPAVLSDDYYADRVFSGCSTCYNNIGLLIPDLGIGRLVENPEQMTAQIDAFLSASSLRLSQGVVTGYAESDGSDFIGDMAKLVCQALQGGGTVADCTYAGANATGDQFLQQVLHADHDIKSLNAHAVPESLLINEKVGLEVSAADLLSTPSDLQGKLVYSIGCHAGLNLADRLDLTESLAERGAYFIGNTGFGWGSGEGVVHSERLMQLLSEQLAAGNRTLGQALSRSKLAYFWETPNPYSRDEKVSSQLTLYGLPMLRIESPLRGRPETVSRETRGLVTLSGGAQRSGYSFDWDFPDAASGAGDTAYYSLHGAVAGEPDRPVLPKLAEDVTAVGQKLHGVVFRGGSYDLIDQPPPLQSFSTTTGYTTPVGSFSAPGWYPSRFFTVNSVERQGEEVQAVVATAGQYNPNTRKQRIFTGMDFDVYHHADSQDWTAPTVYMGAKSLSGLQAGVEVVTSDASGIAEVVIAYTDGAGAWNSKTLSGSGDRWSGTFAATQSTQFFIQAVDRAGNVAVNDNDGGYYRFDGAEAPTGDCEEVNGAVIVADKTYTGTASCHANDQLSTNGAVQVGTATNAADVSFTAGNKIQLKPDFKVLSGSRFRAGIGAE